MSTAAPARCVWCGAAFDAAAARLEGRTRCASCGAATTDPWPSDEALAAAYGDWYRPLGERRFTLGGDSILRRTRSMLAGRIDRISPPGPVLDVGAGEGTLLDALRERGREVSGLERGSARADLRNEPLADIEGEWAAVVFWHSLEHLPEPGDAIRQAARLLVPGGIVAVAIPNIDSLQAKAFGERWLHLDLPRHLVHLSTRSLTAGLERAGFTIQRRSSLRSGQIVIGWLDGLVGSLPGELRLYQSLRRAAAQSTPQPAWRRLLAISAAAVLLPVAIAGAVTELALRRGGTVYVEGRLA